MLDPSQYLRSNYAHLDLQAVLGRPTTVLLGVNGSAGEALEAIGVVTIFDLGSSWLFANAEAIADAGRRKAAFERPVGIPSDWLKSPVSIDAANDMGAMRLECLRGLTDTDAARIASALDVSNIRDFAFWPPRKIARELVSEAMGTTVPLGADGAEELRPRLGEYPTERVYYSTLVMLRLDEGEKRTAFTAPISLALAVGQSIGFTKPAVGAVLTYSQSWYAKGVTLGHMLHSLALAPGEATRIAVIDWSRRTSATATEDITETERLDNATEHARAVSEVQNAVAEELQSGGSLSSGWARSRSEATADSGSTGFFESTVLGSASGSTTTQDASTRTFAQSASWSVGSRSVLASMTQNVNDRTEQHASSVRNRRASAVREVSQSEHEEVSTRVVANYNHMHALTVQYYEVVQVYQVMTQLHRAERCLFVPFEPLDFSTAEAIDLIDRFRGSLVRGALSRRARDLLIDTTTMIAVTPTVRQRFPDFGPEVIRDPEGPLALAARKGGDASGERHQSRFGKFRRPAVWKLEEVEEVSRILGRFVLRPGSESLFLPDETELLALSFEGVNVGTVRVERIGLAASTNTFTVPTETSQVDFPERIRLLECTGIFLTKATSDSILDGRMEVHCSYRGRDFKIPTVALHLAPGTNAQKVVEIRSDEVDRQKELLAHLQANRAHYSQAVFSSLDSATLVMLLSQFSWNGKSLADQVEPKVLTVAGNFVVFKAPLDGNEPSGVVENTANLTWSALLEQRGIDFEVSDTRLTPIPTTGVFAEAVLGRSNSAEKLDITRFWDWQDSPIPLQPPEISPVGTGSRGTAEDIKPGTLNPPVLNIVNPTSLPDPAGLGASLGALANANLFRNMAGLEGTQSLAESGLVDTLSAAGQAGQLASTNIQTEAQKAVAMARIAGDIAKTAITGVPATGSSQGISREGARINHGRDMDDRRIGSATGGQKPSAGPASGTPAGGSSEGQGGGARGGTTEAPSRMSGNVFSHERAYSDQGTYSYSPSGIGELSSVLQPASNVTETASPLPELVLPSEFPQNDLTDIFVLYVNSRRAIDIPAVQARRAIEHDLPIFSLSLDSGTDLLAQAVLTVTTLTALDFIKQLASSLVDASHNGMANIVIPQRAMEIAYRAGWVLAWAEFAIDSKANSEMETVEFYKAEWESMKAFNQLMQTGLSAALSAANLNPATDFLAGQALGVLLDSERPNFEEQQLNIVRIKRERHQSFVQLAQGAAHAIFEDFLSRGALNIYGARANPYDRLFSALVLEGWNTELGVLRAVAAGEDIPL